MKKRKRRNPSAKITLFAGATALMALAPNGPAQTSVDALLNKLEQKGILTVDEAKELRAENQQDSAADINKAINAKFPTPDYVKSYKLYGDFRGRFDEETTDNRGNAADNLSSQNNVRLRYRLRVGLDVNLTDDLQAGLRVGSGDSGNPLSSNQTMQDNASNKSIWLDTAFGKWMPFNNSTLMMATTIGKMDNPFQFSPMIFDADYTPEGAGLQSNYKINDQHSLAFNSGAFVLDYVKGSSKSPWMYGAQAIWNANWTPRFASSIGGGALNIVNPGALGLSGGQNPPNYNPGGVPNNNQGNTRNQYGNLVWNYNPLIATASATYNLDTFPLYNGKFPVKVFGEFIDNPGCDPAKGQANNQGFNAGVQLGKSGKKGLWEILYRYQYLEADAWYDEVVDDDNVAFYANKTTALALNGWVGGTNIKGHLVRLNYSITDALTFSFTAYINELIKPNLNSAPNGEPKNDALHVMADLMWKF